MTPKHHHYLAIFNLNLSPIIRLDAFHFSIQKTKMMMWIMMCFKYCIFIYCK